jgi:hypothetical protein
LYVSSGISKKYSHLGERTYICTKELRFEFKVATLSYDARSGSPGGRGNQGQKIEMTEMSR